MKPRTVAQIEEHYGVAETVHSKVKADDPQLAVIVTTREIAIGCNNFERYFKEDWVLYFVLHGG